MPRKDLHVFSRVVVDVIARPDRAVNQRGARMLSRVLVARVTSRWGKLRGGRYDESPARENALVVHFTRNFFLQTNVNISATR